MPYASSMHSFTATAAAGKGSLLVDVPRSQSLYLQVVSFAGMGRKETS